MSPIESFRLELAAMCQCWCGPEWTGRGLHAPGCHGGEGWVEDFDAMIASVTADADAQIVAVARESEARGRQHGLLAAAMAVETHHQWSVSFRETSRALPTSYWEGCDDAVSDTTHGIEALATEPT